MSLEIKRKIDELNDQLQNYVQPGIFILNSKAKEIFDKVESLQKQCSHHYVDGVCEFCYQEENQ